MCGVSFILPIYNKEKEISRCVESILKQKGTSYEIILVDDGSTDATENECRKYVDIDNIKYIKQENKGVSVARNRGLSEATGNWICFVTGSGRS